MSDKFLFCPCAENCEIRRNYEIHTKQKRLDIILGTSNKYQCLALEAIKDIETGIIRNQELKQRLSKNPECVYVELLNNQLEMLGRIPTKY